MRIAFFLEYPLSTQGGVSVLVRTLIEDMGDEFECILVSPDTAESLQECSVSAKIAAHIPWLDVRQAPSREFREAALRVVDEVSQRRVGLCHFHCGGVFGWGNRWPGCCIPAMLKKRGTPSVWTNHLVVNLLHGYCGPEKPLWFKLAMLPMAWLGKAEQLAAVKTEICVSNHDANKLRRWYFPFRKKICRIYHSRINAEGEWRIVDAEERRPVVLSVGHIAWRKGQHILAEAFAMIAKDHPEWQLQIAGAILEDDCAKHIQHIAQEHGLEGRINLLGSRNDARTLMQQCGIFVQPSLQEALGLALQEALFCGCPAIGTKVGGIPEIIVHGKNGLIVPPNCAKELGQSLSFLIKNKEVRDTFRANPFTADISSLMSRSNMHLEHKSIYTHYSE